MPVALPYIFVLVGLVLLYFGAEWLVGGSSRLAIRLGVKPLVVGLTVVAFGTSTPELLVSVKSVLADAGDIAVGNVVGSNICNVALILGLAALICPMPVSKQLFRFDIPVVIVVSLLAWLFLGVGRILEIWEGAVLLAMIIAYTVYSIIAAKRSGIDGGIDGNSTGGDVSKNQGDGKKGVIAKCVVLIIAGLALLVAGAHFLVTGAVELASSWGISKAVIGLTIVAMGTSLPELATSIVAAIKKQNDIAIGNIVGSNIFNILCILGVVGVMGPISAKDISQRDILLMLALAAALFAPLFMKHVLGRLVGTALLTVYVGYIFVLVREAAG